MPDLGHDVKDFQVFTWRLNNWKKLDKKLTSAEFECGGHKWFVLDDYLPIDPSSNATPGVYCFSRLETPMLHQTIPYLFISTTLSLRRHQKVGMLVLSLHLSFQTSMIPRYLLSAVSFHVLIATNIILITLIHRCAPSFYCGRVWLGFHPFQWIAQTI